MIVSMSKLTLLCSAASVEESLEALRDLGAVHLKHVRTPEGEDLDTLQARVADVLRVLEALPKRSEQAATGKPAAEVAASVLDAMAQRRMLEERLEGQRAEIARLRPFGDFDPELIRALREKRIGVTLYHAPIRNEVKVPGDLVRIDLSRDTQNVYFAVIGTREAAVDGAEEVRLPQEGLAKVEARYAATQNELGDCRALIDRHAGDVPALSRHAAELRERLQFLQARAGMGGADRISYLEGFCPTDRVDEVRAAAARHGWGLLVESAALEDRPPTLLRNPRWVNLIRPVMQFIGISPGYEEVDISAIFLLSFSVFAGMIVGDAGYGLIYLALVLGFRHKLRRLSPQIAPLLALMSVCTIVWGLLTGCFFGMGQLPALLAKARVEWLTHNDNVMYVCFLIGAIHLTIAHGWNVLRMINRPQALAQVGWICNTWGMFFVVRGLVLGEPMPAFLPWLIGGGALLIAGFMTPLAQLKSEWFNHVMLPLNLISNFVDVVSYVRLFAVGLATFAVANAFNRMSVGGGVDSVLAGLGVAVVLFVGHLLNILMSVMGVMVHGIRLNTLEFSGHLGMQWTGVKYAPFAKSGRDDGSNAQ